MTQGQHLWGSMTFDDDRNPLKASLRRARGTLLGVALFSCAVNILMLTGPIFMLQVYDRVLTSRSMATLVALFALTVMLFAFLGLFDFLRSRALSRTGFRLERDLMEPVNRLWLMDGRRGPPLGSRPVQDLTTLRQFLCSNALPALFDLPWVPVYLAIVAMLHPMLGLLALGGAVAVALATLLNELVSRKPVEKSGGLELAETLYGESAKSNAETTLAMGMIGGVNRTWSDLRTRGLAYNQIAVGAGEGFGSAIKALRLLLQSAILALGAYYAVLQEISPGGMIAASILAGRALAPVDQTIASWRLVIRARLARRRLLKALDHGASAGKTLDLPPPKGRLHVNGITKLVRSADSGQPLPILQGVNFTLEPGEGLGVVGPSAAGKSSLARLLVGVDVPDSGAVRLDGARFDQWKPDAVGRYIGYVPQAPSLLVGTVRDNIARFDPSVTDEEVIEAAKLAGTHDMILGLPQGYATELAPGGAPLSGGQAQRVALARAVLRRPTLLVLDEPNANLDSHGDEALARAILALRQTGTTVVVMAHRPSALAAVDKVLVLAGGRQVEFGNKDEVLRKVTQQAPILSHPVGHAPHPTIARPSAPGEGAGDPPAAN